MILVADGVYGHVSIHAPREGCDRYAQQFDSPDFTFQFTHPARGATVGGVTVGDEVFVSIHAPREGCDSMVQSCVL